MGLDTTHNAWHGSYSAFMKWRKEIAYVAGFPPLELMEGFYFENAHNPFKLLDYKYPKGDELDMWALREIKERLPIKWDLFMDNPLTELLYHSDCDGSISYGKCGRIADALENILPLLKDEDAGGHIGNWREKTKQFIDGLRLAHSQKKRLEFH